jgi:hypothetical protein
LQSSKATLDDPYLSRNKHEPIPAFTSLETATKLRHRSEDRYINDHMESELAAYKIEIEKRFKASTINPGYVFPRAKKATAKPESANYRTEATSR